MITIPYRVRRALRKTAVTLVVLALLSIAALSVWMLWLSRFVIYTDEGAKLDFNQPFNPSQGEIATPPPATGTVPISYGDPEDLPGNSSDTLVQINGYSVTAEMLTEHLPAVRDFLTALPSGTAVSLELKNLRGEFYYTTDLGRSPAQADTAAITDLIADLHQKGCYLIAQIPAFRDYWYFLDDETGRVPYGLPKVDGNGSLWQDSSVSGYAHYWFNPASAGTQSFLVQIATELRSMGFDEVVFTDFRFPNTEKIKFDGDKAQTLNDAAQTLAQACSTSTFAVSFDSTAITLPEGRCRLYAEGVAATEISTVLDSLNLTDPASQVVFLTDSADTRFDRYGVLRPVEIPQDQ